MKVMLDDTLIVPEPASVAEAIEAARAKAEETGRLIIGIETDGYPIQEGYLSSPPTDDAGIAEMKLTSANKAEFLQVTIGDAKDAIEEAVKNQKRAADWIEVGEAQKANDPLSHAWATWQAVQDVVSHASQLLGLDPHDVELTGASVATGGGCVEALRETLTEVKRAMTDQDTAALADALREDFDDLATDWRILLETLAERARS